MAVLGNVMRRLKHLLPLDVCELQTSELRRFLSSPYEDGYASGRLQGLRTVC